MEILGLLMVKSLMKTIPKEEMGEDEYEEIDESFTVFFKMILYWLKFGYNYQSKRNF